ncbi:hypothetical protein B0T17DRAFT_494498 [Bombardia bombarda]|uniref:Zn(2)-C6 fungal-type domain-containing protein n=1 Tax=Bombardia bombarda TaxID=252184 RepID=A0AA40C1S9_9PEZI|nr:hypothetical protein B0T17DRAFT_494498 [Bombardia bombarda]
MAQAKAPSTRRRGSNSSNKSNKSNIAANNSQPRQKPGVACEECRKRKLGCSRDFPSCERCVTSGLVCLYNTNRLPRGPKKGDMSALRSRVMNSDRRLSLDETEDCPRLNPLTINTDVPLTSLGDGMYAMHLVSSSDGGFSQFSSPSDHKSVWDNEIQAQQTPLTPAQAPLDLSSFSFPPTPTLAPNGGPSISLLLRDEDTLYFDRVHPNVPMVSQASYFAQSRDIYMSPQKQCLQYAMWTLATALSSQFDNLRDTLYNETTQMLLSFDVSETDMGAVHIEQVQAWLLLAYYDFARVNYRRGWVSAGRAFRLSQLARLHEIDKLGNIQLQIQSPTQVEESRRTFWVAYCLDRFINQKDESLPLTFVQETICTRLPSPEPAFQSGQPVQQCYLSDVISSNDQRPLPPLAECAIIATILGKLRSHSQLSAEVKHGLGNLTDFWSRHEWLDRMIMSRLKSLSVTYPTSSVITDPMVFLSFALAQTALIHLCKAMESTEMECEAVLTSQRRGIDAAREISNISRAHEHIGYFKANIFLPYSFFAAASYLRLYPDTYDTDEWVQVMNDFQAKEPKHPCFTNREQPCVYALRRMQVFNNLARENLCLLDQECPGLSNSPSILNLSPTFF